MAHPSHNFHFSLPRAKLACRKYKCVIMNFTGNSIILNRNWHCWNCFWLQSPTRVIQRGPPGNSKKLKNNGAPLRRWWPSNLQSVLVFHSWWLVRRRGKFHNPASQRLERKKRRKRNTLMLSKMTLLKSKQRLSRIRKTICINSKTKLLTY